MPRGVSRTREAERQARRAREAEVDRLFRFARLELFVLEAEAGAFRLESGVVAGVTAGDVVQLLQVLLLDNQWFGRDVPGGVVLCRYDAFAAELLRSARRRFGGRSSPALTAKPWKGAKHERAVLCRDPGARIA